MMLVLASLIGVLNLLINCTQGVKIVFKVGLALLRYCEDELVSTSLF